MRASVLTLVRDRVPHLAELVRALRRSRVEPIELLIAWMGGEDPHRALPPGLELPARVIVVDGEEMPLARARNDLARAARGECLVFLDVDCIPGRDLVGAYAAVLAEHDAIAVGRTLYLPPGAGGEEEELRRLAEPHPQRERLFSDGVRLDRRHEHFWSLNFAVRRSCFLERIGGFDEGYVGYGIEDTDFALRVRAREVPLAWVREAVAFHQHHPPTRQRADSIPALVRNAKRFQRSWGSWPARGWLEELSARGLIRWDERENVLEPTSLVEVATSASHPAAR
jgi:N-acetylglucosaminyl-diphospho-decaprenol L-rhamnosyltransferase